MDRALFSILTTLKTYAKSKQKHFAENSDHLRLGKATASQVIRVVSLRRDARCFPLFVFHFKKHFASCGACKYVCREPFCSLEKLLHKDSHHGMDDHTPIFLSWHIWKPTMYKSLWETLAFRYIYPSLMATKQFYSKTRAVLKRRTRHPVFQRSLRDVVVLERGTL